MKFRITLECETLFFDGYEVSQSIYGSEKPGYAYVQDVRDAVGVELELARIAECEMDRQNWVCFYITDESLIKKIPQFNSSSQITILIKKADALNKFYKKTLLKEVDHNTGEIRVAKFRIELDHLEFLRNWIKDGCPSEIN